MGRPRKVLSMQRGNLTVLEQQRKSQQEERIIVGQEKLSRPPAWLKDNFAKKIFKLVVSVSKQDALIGNRDIINITGLCNAFSSYCEITKEIGNNYMISEKETNPLVKLQEYYSAEVRRYEALCGFTLDSRLKLAAIQITKQEQALESDFGEI